MASKKASEKRTLLPLFSPVVRSASAAAQPNAVAMVQAPSAAAQPNAVAMVQALADPLDPAGECPVCDEKFTSRSQFRFHLGKHFAHEW